jgi:LacI family transcriptional regulator
VAGRIQGRRAVLADVARLAGVSTSIASKILNDVSTVSVRPETRQRVLDAAARLEYRPHATARALAGGASRALALLVPELTNPVYSKTIRGAFAEAKALGYTVMVAEDWEGQEADESFGNLVSAGHVDGLLVASAHRGSPVLRSLGERRIPHVFVNRPVAGSGRNVTMDVAGASRLAVDYLSGLGHRVIGHVAGPRDLETGRTRAVAFSAAAAELGVSTAPISYETFDERGGYQATVRLLRRSARLTAIYSSSLSQAVGVVHAIHERGARIPEDISVVAYDDLPMADYLTPPLDTIAMPLAELGRTAVRALVEQINGADPADIQVRTAPRIVRRGSATPPA